MQYWKNKQKIMICIRREKKNEMNCIISLFFPEMFSLHWCWVREIEGSTEPKIEDTGIQESLGPKIGRPEDQKGEKYAEKERYRNLNRDLLGLCKAQCNEPP